MLADSKAYTDKAVSEGVSGEHNHDNRYYTKAEIDEMEFITVADIDAICGANIKSSSEVEF